MDERLKQILEALPRKPPRSRLEPYREFIEELRHLGRTYREIAAILAEKCQVRVSSSAVHEFARARSQRQYKTSPRASSGLKEPKKTRMFRKAEGEEVRAVVLASDDDVRRKIAALRVEQKVAKPTPERFQFDPTEPLRIKKARHEGNAD
jgi:hypothetical protein